MPPPTVTTVVMSGSRLVSESATELQTGGTIGRIVAPDTTRAFYC
ncbi:MAG: hypothetical protein R6W83_06950 [Cryobacterium sp.]